MLKKIGFSIAALFALVGSPQAANAESTFTTGTATPLAGSARLDFRITIPKFVFIRVGTGTDMATTGTIDLIDFTVPAASIGNGTAINGTGGDLPGGGVVTARVRGNNGAVSFSANTSGALTNAASGGDTIAYDQIGVAVATNTTTTMLTPPTLAPSGGTNSVTLPNTVAGGKVTNLDAKWTFTYLNQNIVAPGTYGGVNTQNGRVTYSVSMP